MATIDEAEHQYKEARKGIVIRPEVDESILFVIRMPPDGNGVFIRKQWYDQTEKEFHAWNEEWAALGRSPMMNFCMSAVRIDFDDKDEKKERPIFKKAIASLDGTDFAKVRGLNKTRARDGKMGFDTTIFEATCIKDKGKKVYDVSPYDWITDAMRAEIAKIDLFTLAEIEEKVVFKKKDEKDSGGKTDMGSFKNGGGSKADGPVDQKDVDELIQFMKARPDFNAISADLKTKFAIAKAKDLKVSQWPAVQEWRKNIDAPAAAAAPSDDI